MTRRPSDHRGFTGALGREELDLLMGCIGGSPIPAFVIDRDHRLIYWNRALEELSKIKAEEVIGTSQQWRAFYSRQRPCLADLLVEGAVTDIPQWYGKKYLKSPLIDDAYEATDFFPELGESGRWLRFTAALLRDPEGPVLGAVETLEDITERKAAEAALLKAHEELEMRVRERTTELAVTNEILQRTTDHLSLLLESLPIVSYTRNASGKYEVTYVSNSVGEITGYMPSDFIGQPVFWQNQIHPDDRSRVLKELRNARGDGTYHCEYRFRASDQTYRWFSDFWRLVRMPDAPVPYFVGIWQDVTEEKRIRQENELRLQQIIQTHKLTALGEVVAGVAHEINNPVSFISYNIPLLEEIWDTLEPVFIDHDASAILCEQRGVTRTEIVQNMREIIHAFKMATSRINRVITGLKEFSRSDDLAGKKAIQVADVIQGVMVIVGGQMRKTVSVIEQQIEPGLPSVLGHFQKLEQVMTNLLINAYQSISPGRKGKITITARHLPRLDAVVVAIEDNGKGMARETMDHIFDPFFTTRRDSGGTGLGLSISYGLIKEHGGTISVLSQPKVGSRFTLYLPREGRSLPRMNPRLLFVDSDDAFLKDIQTYFLEAATWQIESVEDEERILQYLTDYPEVDWVICAMDLKYLSGWQLMDGIKKRYPLLRTVLYGRDGDGIQGNPDLNFNPSFTIQKPFDMDKLQKMIQEAGRQRL
ncbi:MAG: PAS domain-containing protein [Syntrophales bacterium]|nr:PAS domain-containing protein [Syntrophales bacterium]MCK9391923.1 PAS domain-containing protein [Syntrophales bacterium]